MKKIFLMNRMIIFGNKLLRNKVNVIERSDVKWKKYWLFFYVIYDNIYRGV